MSKRKVEVFTAGFPVCQPTVDLVNKLACSSCEVKFPWFHRDENKCMTLKRKEHTNVRPKKAKKNAIFYRI